MSKRRDDGRGLLPPMIPSEEAWCFLVEKSGKARFTLVGVARVVVEEVDTAKAILQEDAYAVRVLGSNPNYMEGRKLNLKRAEMWACSSEDERLAFGEQVARFWPSRRSSTSDA